MAYHHVIAKVGSDDAFRSLFSDLNDTDLRNKFIRPYEMGKSFFSGHDLISPSDLRSLKIIRTEKPEKTEREEINRIDRANIDEMNRSGRVIFISIGRGFSPEHIADAGQDITHEIIKGPPGYKPSSWSSPKVLAWLGTIVAAIVAAGIAKVLGFV